MFSLFTGFVIITNSPLLSSGWSLSDSLVRIFPLRELAYVLGCAPARRFVRVIALFTVFWRIHSGWRFPVSITWYFPFGIFRVSHGGGSILRFPDVIASFTVSGVSATDFCLIVTIIWVSLTGMFAFPRECSHPCFQLNLSLYLVVWRQDSSKFSQKKSALCFANFCRGYWQGINFVV